MHTRWRQTFGKVLFSSAFLVVGGVIEWLPGHLPVEMNAPLWVIRLIGGIFILAGLAVLIDGLGGLFGSERKPGGMSWLTAVFVAVGVCAFAVVIGAIALVGDADGFEGGSVAAGRIWFGVAALVAGAIGAGLLAMVIAAPLYPIYVRHRAAVAKLRISAAGFGNPLLAIGFLLSSLLLARLWLDTVFLAEILVLLPSSAWDVLSALLEPFSSSDAFAEHNVPGFVISWFIAVITLAIGVGVGVLVRHFVRGKPSRA